MAFLTLKGIGKIYVSEGNVSVGIRGVDLSFDRGEFVAVTGSSGSGKSTLLNVISGMDSYEEGELFIEGNPTSHYRQPDWETYREKYISFVFQDYNIIESYTVLENVELALMNIPDRRERRRRALELLDRVGLSSHVRQKGSKLSGGQKQRTVIARALAKDSPIILADEPTGNLDAETSREIIELLHEVSKDKLLIVVTHNFEQVESVATRHVRVYDGSVEADEVIHPAEPVAPFVPASSEEETNVKKLKRSVGNGALLGTAIFKSTPRLSAFLVFLLLMGTLAIFLATSLTGNAANLFEKTNMFRPIEGRLIVTKRNGDPITSTELNTLKETYGAKEAIRYDYLYDQTNGSYWDWDTNVEFDYLFAKDSGKSPKIGTAPQAYNEVHLYLPISASMIFGSDSIDHSTFTLTSSQFYYLDMKVTGITYFYDNTKPAEVRLSNEGWEFLTALSLLSNSGTAVNLSILRNGEEKVNYQASLSNIKYSNEIGQNDIRIPNSDYDSIMRMQTTYPGNYSTTFSASGKRSLPGDSTMVDWSSSVVTASSLTASGSEYVVLHPSYIVSVVNESFDTLYRQTSLLFSSDWKAKEAASDINSAGYLAVMSNETYSPDPMETISNTIVLLLSLVLWVGALFFFSFFIGLCCSKSIHAFRGDMSIMRSMGIPVRVIRIGMYVRMLLSLIPALFLSAAVCFVLYRLPKTNAVFPFLAPWQFVLILVGMIALSMLTTRNQVKRLFSVSVKKSLKGGDAE